MCRRLRCRAWVLVTSASWRLTRAPKYAASDSSTSAVEVVRLTVTGFCKLNVTFECAEQLLASDWWWQLSISFWTPSNNTSRPICSDSLNLMPPAPLYLRTLWHYTNAVIIIIVIILFTVLHFLALNRLLRAVVPWRNYSLAPQSQIYWCDCPVSFLLLIPIVTTIASINSLNHLFHTSTRDADVNIYWYPDIQWQYSLLKHNC